MKKNNYTLFYIFYMSGYKKILIKSLNDLTISYKLIKIY